MEEIALNAARVVALVATLGGPLWAAGRVVRRALPEADGSARLTATGVVAFGLLALVVRVTGALGALWPEVVAVACLAVATVAGLLCGTRLPTATGIGTALADFSSWLARSRMGLGLAAVAAGVLVIAAARAMLMPPLAYDSLTYHMVFVARWVQDGAIGAVVAPDAMDGYSHFPILGEMLPVALVLPFHSDLFANLAGFPWLGLLAVSTHGVARTAGASRPFALAVAALVSFTPAAFAYVTTQYVDLEVAALLVSATLFLLRLRESGAWADAALLSLSAGLALGTKLTAAPFVALLLVACVGVQVARVARSGTGRRTAILQLVAGAGLLVAAGGETYLRNLVETGNPVYPYPLALFGIRLAEQSAYQERVWSTARLGSDFMDMEALRVIFGFRNDGIPLTAGPAYPLLAAVALLPAVAMRLRRMPPAYALLLPLAFLPLLAFFADSAPGAAGVRRLWPDASARFLVAPLALVAVAAALVLDRAGRLRTAGLLALLVAASYAGARANLAFESPVDGILLSVGIACAAAIAVVSWRHLPRVPRWRIAAGMLALALAGLGTTVLSAHRESTRWSHYEHHVDLHPIPTFAVDGWRACDRPEAPATIAMATGWEWPGHNWILYPLAGSRLQNRVVYADVQRRGQAPTHVDSGLLREHPDPDVWIENLDDLGVDIVFLQQPFPVELRWMEERPERFRPVRRGDGYAIFEVTSAARTSPRSPGETS